MRQQIHGDFVRVIDPRDRTYVRYSRATMLGATLDDDSADRDKCLPGVFGSCAPFERALLEQSYLAGAAPADVDYAVFSVVRWARVGTARDVLANADGMDGVRAWRARMVALHNRLGDRSPLYPLQHTGPDGRAAFAE